MKWYQDEYGESEWEQKMLVDTVHMVSVVQLTYENTAWTHDNVEYMCFDIVLAGKLDLVDRWVMGKYAITGDVTMYTPAGTGDMDDYLVILEQYASDHANQAGWHFDVIHAIINTPQCLTSVKNGITSSECTSGKAYLGAICDGRNGRTAVGVETMARGEGKMYSVFDTAITLSHELGHNLGAQHDFIEGSSSQCQEGDFFHIMGYRAGYVWHQDDRLSFSRCTVRLFHDKFINGDYHCLFRRHYGECQDFVSIDLKADLCGNGVIDIFEECEPPNSTCCNAYCHHIVGCCASDEVYQCIEIANDGDYFDQYSGSYDGYYGGCVKEDRSEMTQPAVYKQNRGRGQPLYLRQQTSIEFRVVDGELKPNPNPQGERYQGCSNLVDTKFLGENFRSSWMIVQRPEARKDDGGMFQMPSQNEIPENYGDVQANSMCPSYGGMTISDGCPWTSIQCNEWAPYTKRVEGFHVRVMEDNSSCTIPYDPAKCRDDLEWSNIPESITITGSEVIKTDTRIHSNPYEHTLDMNGEWTRNGEQCWQGMPVFQNEWMMLHYDTLSIHYLVTSRTYPQSL